RARWRTPDGGSRQRDFTKKAAAEAWLTTAEKAKLDGGYIDPAKGKTSVGAYWEAWSERQPWRATSRLGVTSLFTNHVLPAFGSRALSSLRPSEIEVWARGLPLSGRTARQAAQYLSTLLESAVRDGLLAT